MHKSTDSKSLIELWSEYATSFGTDEQALIFLMHCLDAGVPICRNCGSQNRIAYSCQRTYRCTNCRAENSRTANTFIACIRRPQAFLGAMFLSARAALFNACDLARLSGIANSSAWCICQKLNMAKNIAVFSEMPAANSEDHDIVQVSSAGFAEIINRRSIETERRQHPRSEIATVQGADGADDQPTMPGSDPRRDYITDAGNVTDDRSETNSAHCADPDRDDPVLEQLAGNEKLVYSKLSHSGPIHFDILQQATSLEVGKLCATITMLQLSDLIVRLPGDYYKRYSEPLPAQSSAAGGDCTPLSEEQTKMCAPLVQYIRRGFCGISRKYLQLYATAYSYNVLPVREFTSFVQRCLRLAPIRSKDLRAYVSPEAIQFCSSASAPA
jgi:hypothetical protein